MNALVCVCVCASNLTIYCAMTFTAKCYLNIIILTESIYGQPDGCGPAVFSFSE